MRFCDQCELELARAEAADVNSASGEADLRASLRTITQHVTSLALFRTLAWTSRDPAGGTLATAVTRYFCWCGGLCSFFRSLFMHLMFAWVSGCLFVVCLRTSVSTCIYLPSGLHRIACPLTHLLPRLFEHLERTGSLPGVLDGEQAHQLAYLGGETTRLCGGHTCTIFHVRASHSDLS